MDEAGQAIEPETLVALSRLDRGGRCVLIGDHRQLPPSTKCSRAKFIQTGVSLFERLYYTPGFDPILLDEQYRMLRSIARWPSQLFYANKLRNAASVECLPPMPGFAWPADGSGIAFVHCGTTVSHFWNILVRL